MTQNTKKYNTTSYKDRITAGKSAMKQPVLVKEGCFKGAFLCKGKEEDQSGKARLL